MRKFKVYYHMPYNSMIPKGSEVIDAENYSEAWKSARKTAKKCNIAAHRIVEIVNA